MTELEWDWDADVLENLNRFIGIDLRFVLGIPKHPLVGDRVLYLLSGGQRAAREMEEKLAAQWALDEQTRKAQPHPHVGNLDSVPLGNMPSKIQLRVTDLLGELCFWRGQRRYLESKWLMPAKDWGVHWVLGALFLADRRVMVYADFRHPQVGLVFTEAFFKGTVGSTDSLEEQQKAQSARLLERLQGALTLKNKYSRREGCKWAKIVNVCCGPQWMAVMDPYGTLTMEQIPYPDQ